MSPPSVSRTPGEIYQQEMVPAIFALWAPELVGAAAVAPGNRVLDVACGTGVVSRAAAERVGPRGRVVGLDLNPDMLAAARAGSAGVPIEWQEGSAQSLPFADESFDVVLCQQGLQFFPDKAAALAEMRRVLGPGGRLALSVWKSVTHSAFFALEQALARRIGPDKAKLPPFSLGDAATLRSLVIGAGFADVRLVAEVKMHRFASAERLVRAVVGGAPSMLGELARQGAQALEDIVREVTEALRDYVDDGGLAAPVAAHVVTARR